MNVFFNNSIISGIIVALIISAIFWLRKKFIDHQAENRIINFLKDSDDKFRSTHSMSSSLNMSEETIQEVCSKSLKIIRNQKDKETWRLAE